MIETEIPMADQPPLEQMLPQAIAQILAMPQTLEQIQQSQSEQSEQIAQLEETQSLQGQSLQSLEGSTQKLTEAVKALYGKQECLERTSRQNTLLSEQHYQQHVIEPLVRRIFPLIDILSESGSGSNGNQFPNARSDILAALAAELRELLAGYGVEPIQVADGSPFDAKIMKPVRFVTTFRSKDDKIVESMDRLGFRRDELILRPAAVCIYCFKSPKHFSSEL